MAHLQFHNYKGVGEELLEAYGFSQAVRIDNTIHISGQGGWTRDKFAVHQEIDAQIDQAFENVDYVLKDAGGKGWSQVFKVMSYHLPLNDEAMAAMKRNFDKWMPGHKALWTCVGVTRLGTDEMKVEIEVQAHDPK